MLRDQSARGALEVGGVEVEIDRGVGGAGVNGGVLRCCSHTFQCRTSAYGVIVPVASTVPGFTQRRLWMVLGALMLAVLLANLETTIIATALPTIAGEFNAFEYFAWVGTAYLITSTISTPLLGKLSDLYGRRRIFQTTMAIFLVGSLLCGAAQSMGQLIGFRAVQGVGGGGIQALAFAILGDILPPRERGRYIGYFTLAFVGAALLGPLVGGFIIDHYSWPWIFWVNVPLAAVAIIVCHFALRLPFRRREAKLDYAGAALLSLTIAVPHDRSRGGARRMDRDHRVRAPRRRGRGALRLPSCGTSGQRSP